MEWGKDYLTRSVPSNPKVALSGPVVFAGYGSEGEYKGLNVKGAIVAVLRDAPHSGPSDVRAHLGIPVEQSRVAAAHGAIG
ncbi:hypothetical protein, partial [Klebsiella pneumoniae]